MTTLTLISAAIMVFFVAALLYFQSRKNINNDNYTNEGFQTLARAAWNPQHTPIAGRLYDPNTVPADLNSSPFERSMQTIPLSHQRPILTPGGGSQTMPRDALARIADLHELDNKITTWLDAAGLKEREQPGSLTSEQQQKRIVLMTRLRDVREQIGTGIILDSWKRVADETLQLRTANQGWQQTTPNLDDVNSFGSGVSGNSFLTAEQYKDFLGLLNTVIYEMQGLVQADPLQKVRLQQLQVTLQDLLDIKNSVPPIKMSAAKKYLQQMLKIDQPLPTLLSIDTPTQMHQDNPFDILADLKDIEWSFRASYDPATQELKRATTSLMNKLRDNQITPQNARSQVLQLKEISAPLPSNTSVGQQMQQQGQQMQQGQQQGQQQGYDPKNHILRANVLCKQIREAFPLDATALGCIPRVTDVYQANTVINTVCNRLKYSVPTVSTEQFNCPV